MRLFGLIGFPLSHSFSKNFFSEKFQKEQILDCAYELFPIANVDELPNLIKSNPTLGGLNVTIPHKINVMPYLTAIDDAARAVGAVNCISIKDGELKGYNTDVFGFTQSLKPLLQKQHEKALILGSGGAAQAVKYALKELKIPYLVVSRNPTNDGIAYNDVTKAVLEQHQLIINTTPLGMSPNVESSPELPYQYLTPQHLAYDLVYNPEETLFLAQAKQRGAQIKNGLEMLFLQAERSWYIWNT